MKTQAAVSKSGLTDRGRRRGAFRVRAGSLAPSALDSSGPDSGGAVPAALEGSRSTTLPALIASPFKPPRAPLAPGTAPVVPFPLVDIARPSHLDAPLAAERFPKRIFL